VLNYYSMIFIFVSVTPTYYLTIICNQQNASVAKTPIQVQFINTSVTIIFTYSNIFQHRHVPVYTDYLKILSVL